MKMTKAVLALALFALIAFSGLAQMSEQDQAKAMEAYMKAGAVTADHEALKYFTGRWRVEGKMWAAPGAPPTESLNSSEGEMILGGRYVRLSYKGEMMGQPFEGLQISRLRQYCQGLYDLLDRQFFDQFLPAEGDVRRVQEDLHVHGPLGPIRWAATRRSGWSSGSSRPDEHESQTFMVMPDGKGIPETCPTAASGSNNGP